MTRPAWLGELMISAYNSLTKHTPARAHYLLGQAERLATLGQYVAAAESARESRGIALSSNVVCLATYRALKLAPKIVGEATR